jgi:hypothetical protein
MVQKNILRFIALLAVIVLTIGNFAGTVMALTPGQKQIMDAGVTNYNLNSDTACAGLVNGTASGGDLTGGTTIWNSGLQPPYILEQFAIETLKAVAQKKGVDQTATVTQEHVIALLAFMIGEGGDINNNDLFNPLNTGLNAPELLATSNASNGLQSFKSFDAGVEATARTIVGGNQSRLAGVLTDPATTADQFMTALTYFNRYPGNAFWAEASVTDPSGYLNGRLSLVNKVRNNYANLASIVLGTSAHEETANIRDPSKLQFHPTSDTGGTPAASTGGAESGGACVPSATGATVGTGCGVSGLQVPQGGTGTNTCYFNQSQLSGGGYDWPVCGCLPTSSLIIQSTLEGNPNLSNVDVLNGVKSAGGIASDGCSGVVQGAVNYFKGKGYQTNTILAEHSQTNDAILAQVKAALSQGALVLTHTSTSVDSAGSNPTTGHFLVVYAVDTAGNLYVANPGAQADKNKPIPPSLAKTWLDMFISIKKG